MRQMCSHNELRETLVTVAVAMRGFERSWQAPRQAMQGRSRRGVAVLRETARTLQGEVCVVSPMVCRAEWRECDRKCTVTMSEAKEVGVKFRKTSSLTASKAAGSQPGIINPNRAGRSASSPATPRRCPMTKAPKSRSSLRPPTTATSSNSPAARARPKPATG